MQMAEGEEDYWLLFLKLLFMDNIHYYIYIYRNISELFDCSVFKRQLSKDFVGMYTIAATAMFRGNKLQARETTTIIRS